MSNGHNTVIASPKVVEKYREISRNITDPSELNQLRSLFEREYSLEELIDWIHAILASGTGSIDPSKEIPFLSTLIKKETDYNHFMNAYARRRGSMV